MGIILGPQNSSNSPDWESQSGSHGLRDGLFPEHLALGAFPAIGLGGHGSLAHAFLPTGPGFFAGLGLSRFFACGCIGGFA